MFDALRDLGTGHRYAPGAEPNILERTISDILHNGLDPLHLIWLLPVIYLISGLTGSSRAIHWSRRRY